MGPDANIVLIGMPGAGKSTVGVLLAKALSRSFLDTDILLQTRQGRTLQSIIEEQGTERFLEIEEAGILSLRLEKYVIATGGSVVYSPKAMAHLGKRGVIVLLDLSLPLLVERIQDMKSRGIVLDPGQDLEDLYRRRKSLYDQYADIRIACDRLGHEAVLRKILSRLSAWEAR